MDYSKYVLRTAGCPAFGDWAIKNKLTVKWGNAKRGDIVLFDFNGNGTSDHIGIVTKATSSYIETIEGNTGSGSNTNGDGVYRRRRTKGQVNYFVRTKCPDIESVIRMAEAELGYKEGRNNSNKYGKWFGMNNVSWCCIFVVYCFAHALAETKPLPKPTGKYTGVIPVPTLKNGSEGVAVKNLQSFLNWYGCKLTVDGDFGSATQEAVKLFQKSEGISSDGIYGKNSYAKASTYKEDVPTPTKEAYSGSFPDFVQHSRNYLDKIARELAYAKGTTKATYNYKTGKPKGTFTTAIKKVYGSVYSKWSKQCRLGASCDVFVGTVLRYSGCDPTWPRGLQYQIKKTPKHMSQVTDIKAGDMMYYLYDGGGHTRMIVDIDGKLYNCEANYQKNGGQYGHIDTLATAKPKNATKMLKIFRVTSAFRTYLEKGDVGSEVTRWQKFLKWYGYDCAADGDFREKTEGFTKTFQLNNGLTADGQVGAKTIAKAKEIKK